MIYAKEKNYTLYKGKMQDVLDTLEENSIDSIVCDPPYELNFMGKGWDNQGIAFQPDTWKHCYRVLKDGGYLLAFGGSRTFHRIACAIEDAGFEIRDTIMWLYGSGFPKSMNIGLAIDKKNGVDNRTGNIVKGVGSNNTNSMKNRLTESQQFANKYEQRKAQNKWSGWGTALKPSFEPIIVARKPFKGSLVDNVIENGVGGINIDECRVDFVSQEDYKIAANKNQHEKFGSLPMTNNNVYGDFSMIKRKNYSATGRFPANVILTYDETDFDEVCGGMPDTKSNIEIPNQKHTFKGNKDAFQYGYKMRYGSGFNDEGNASRYFYCAKASKKDRDEGLDLFENVKKPEYCLQYHEGKQINEDVFRKNIHPTVKPIELMQYLVRLVTPKNATILDCFMGSGSTGKAVMFENRERNANYYFIGVEMTEEYLPICKARIDYALNKYEFDFQKQLQDEKDKGQLSIFDFME